MPQAHKAVVQTLGHEFSNPDLITEALTHRSYSHEKRLAYNNERLEFLGDTVLDLCVSHLLCEGFPDADEGTLSALRSQFVSELMLAEVAEALGMGDWLMLGKGEERMGGRQRDSLLADAFEAVLGALYLDAGLQSCLDFLKKVFDPKIQEFKVAVEDGGRPRDPKSRLQELCQQAWGVTPSYACVAESRDGSQRVFEMSLRLQGVEILRCTGNSKKEATLAAAQEFLKTSDGDIKKIAEILKDKTELVKEKKGIYDERNETEIIPAS